MAPEGWSIGIKSQLETAWEGYVPGYEIWILSVGNWQPLEMCKQRRV